MTLVVIFLIALFCALWISTSGANKKKKLSKKQPGSSSEIAGEPIVTDNSSASFHGVTPPDLSTKDADMYHHDYGGHSDTGSRDFNSYH